MQDFFTSVNAAKARAKINNKMHRVKKHMVRAKYHAVRHAKKLKELRAINNLLTLIVVLLGLYIVLAPFWPQAKFVIAEKSPAKRWLSKAPQVKKDADGVIGSNRLFIPSLGLEELVYEGGYPELEKGPVHRGNTSTPDKGGNTVIVGHRFMYNSKAVFYNLDKLKVGDEITVHWDHVRYKYAVTDTYIVEPNDITVEAPTDNSILTLYTCTPLWTSKQRLVIRADLKEPIQ